MKKVVLSITLIIALMFGSCSQMGGGGGNSPEAVAEKFINYMGKGDFDKAAKYGTESTKKFLEMAQKMATEFEDLSEEMYKEQKAKRKPSYTEFKLKKLEGDIAIVEYKFKGADKSVVDQDVHLRNVNGKWLVDMEIGDGMDMDMDEMEEKMDMMKKGMDNIEEDLGDMEDDLDEMDDDTEEMGASMEEINKNMEKLGDDMSKMMEDAAKALEKMGDRK